MKFKHLLHIFILSLLIFCSKPASIETAEKTVIMMDTYVTIRIYDGDKSMDEKQKLIEQTVLKIAAIESLTTHFKEYGEMAKINANPTQEVELSPVLLDIFQQAQHVSSISNGAFDITIAPLIKLWGFGTDGDFRVPSDNEIDKVLPFINFQNIQLDGNKLSLKNPNTQIDLGGIAKGYAVDVGIEFLKNSGVTDAQIDAGGDLRTLSSELTKGMRNVYVRHPKKRDGFFGRFKMDEGAVATSGDYERFFEKDGVRYHHILDPKTGYPSRQCTSVTIKSTTTAMCDALSTTVFILGPEKGLALLEKLPETEGIIIYEKSGKLEFVASSGLEKIFEKQ